MGRIHKTSKERKFNGGFYKMPNSAVLDKKLSDGAFRLLNVIMKDADKWKPICSDLARKMGKTKRQISRYMEELIKEGYMKRTYTGKEYLYEIYAEGTDKNVGAPHRQKCRCPTDKNVGLRTTKERTIKPSRLKPAEGVDSNESTISPHPENRGRDGKIPEMETVIKK